MLERHHEPRCSAWVQILEAQEAVQVETSHISRQLWPTLTQQTVKLRHSEQHKIYFSGKNVLDYFSVIQV